jgi:carbamoyl-phosphate synthase small subunit
MTFNAALILEDGKVFLGQGIGKKGTTKGELCFNTSMTGYQEILTDPSYYKQIINFTFPHIGNTGTNDEDYESAKVFATGLITGAEITQASSFRANSHFNNWLLANNITGISGVDTRALTLYIRENGAKNCVIVFADTVDEIDFEELLATANKVPSMNDMELAMEVTCEKPYKWNIGAWKLGEGYNNKNNLQNKYNVVAVDFGIKQNILRCLSEIGCDVTVVPANTSAEEILAYNPDGIFLSNGPGDPAATAEYAEANIKELVASGTPIFGICLGHQLLATALGCKTEKLKQGHRGANHPVKNLQTNIVEITSQNHGFAVNQASIPDSVEQTHISLFDGTNEGIRLKGKPVFSVQHHPEASPGPRDAYYLFAQFVQYMEDAKQGKKAA